jgi:predicted Zn-dependent protease
MSTTLPRKIRRIVALFLLTAAGTGRQAVAFPSSLLEQKEMAAAPAIGRATAATLLQSNVVLFAPALQAQIQQLADELATAAESPIAYRIHLINSPFANLMTLPSGDIFVFTGFLEKVESRDELAFGLAHEISHVHLHHGLQQLKKGFELQRRGSLVATILTSLVATAVGSVTGSLMALAPVGALYTPLFSQGAIAPISGMVANVAAKVPEALIAYLVAVAMGLYSQEQEAEADRQGLLLMQKAGYNPTAALTVMQKFAEEWHPR